MREITAGQLVEMAELGHEPLILDVREPDEVEVSMIEGAVHIPLNDLPARIKELDELRRIVVVCRMGTRSARVTQFLLKNGFDAMNLKGGMQAFVAEVDPTIPVA